MVGSASAGNSEALPFPSSVVDVEDAGGWASGALLAAEEELSMVVSTGEATGVAASAEAEAED
jgi:hypothetical protein